VTDTLSGLPGVPSLPGRYRHSAPRLSNRHRLQRWWSEISPRSRAAVQLGLLIVAVIVAYNYSLSTLLQNAGQDTPLAYVSLVPAIALALAAIRARPLKREPAIHDRQVDYTVGLPLLVFAIGTNILLPARWSTMFWVYRVDLFTLPFFVAGAVAILFGVRVLWRQKLAIGFLFLAWPYPYQSVLLRLLDAFTAGTLFCIERIVTVVHVATTVPSVDNTLFSVVHHGQSFPLSIVSACSGVNSVVGFLLVGSAFAAVVRGPALRKVVWLLSGMLLLWMINLGRIIFIFWSGQMWGEHVAINILHPFIGMVTFSIGVVVMLLMMRPMGLHIEVGTPQGSALDAPQTTRKAVGSPAVPKVLMAVVVALVAALVLGVTNFGLRSYNLVATASGEPRLTAYIDQPVVPTGWSVLLTDTYDWAKPLFGTSSVWNRYLLLPTGAGTLHTNVKVVADVINTPDLASFGAYGIENCYQFHGYALADVAQVGLPGHITGQAMSYTSQQFGSWSIIYWIVPVKNGSTTSYERVVLYVQNTGSGAVVKGLTSPARITNLSGSLSSAGGSAVTLANNRTFLVAFASQLIGAQALHRAAPTRSTAWWAR
jgi:exosortase/archaeosortase family protein